MKKTLGLNRMKHSLIRPKKYFRTMLWILIATLLPACGLGDLLRRNPDDQRYLDRTQQYFSNLKGGIQMARFGRVNRDSLSDLLILRSSRSGRPSVQVWINQEGKEFTLNKRPGWVGKKQDRVVFMAVRDLNRDRTSDMILVGKFADGSNARLLFNNGKGYFYSKTERPFPEVRSGMERVDLVDMDGDGDVDLFFTGKNVLDGQGKPLAHQAQFFLNDGTGQFSDATFLLLPPSRPGIVGTAFADYDSDGAVDVFLIYDNGFNGLLINNGVGKFIDKSRTFLPHLSDASAHADWADFDGDGDNDLLVANKSIPARDRSHANEFNYMLVNQGHGYFKKGPLRVLPQHPSRAVYLLDANGSEIPDIIILSSRGIHYLQGRGKWKFWKESRRRLPENVSFQELIFADVNDDDYLDIFGITTEGGMGKLWINHFD